MSKKLGIEKISDNKEYERLLQQIMERSKVGVEKAADEVRKAQLETYWDNGRYIVEYEQNGKKYAEYGLERSFYAKQCTVEKWNVRTLKRQKKSALFLRLAASTDKQGILKLAERGVEIQTAEDVVKDTYTLEFLNLNEKLHYDEKDLENRILEHLQEFLLELGKGFTFVKKQYPMNIGNKVYWCDLVFYHRILKCFVLIDLKKDDVQHDDIGQMNTYMGYIAEEENMPDDNPPVGIILARGKDELLVKYATYGMDSNLFVSKYELYLPNKDELKRLVDNIMKETNEE